MGSSGSPFSFLIFSFPLSGDRRRKFNYWGPMFPDFHLKHYRMATDVLQWNGTNVASPPVVGIPEVEVAS
jgi:hypothetical protein